jgi:hypothetical protein
MPPRIMFRSKLRLGQLEFPSCDPCNQLTKASDQVAALVGRFLPDAVTSEEKADFRKILTGLKNNMRPVLEEMNLGTAEEEQVRRRTTAYAGVAGGFIYLGGPLMQGYLNAFGCKLALAMHWEATKLIVPVQGGVALRLYSNVDAIEGKLPRPLLNLLPPELHTLKQGRWNVRDQFEYSMGVTRNHRMGAFFARFRSSFAVTAVTAFDRADPLQTSWNVFSPAELWSARS